jgi:G3E family GTPase
VTVSAAVPSPARSLPCIVLGGWLGAGKTTLINHLLRHADGRRIAVAVNDFGDVSIDADLIEGADGNVLALAGGCICCAIGSDLFSGLRAIAAREPAPDILLLETSGVALPAAVARTARLVPGIDVQGTAVLFDSQAWQEHLADRYIADTVIQQVDEADLLLLSKVDQVTPAQQEAAQQWLSQRQPTLPVIPVSRGEIDPQVLLGLAGDEAFGGTRGVPSAAASRSSAGVLLCSPALVDEGPCRRWVAPASAMPASDRFISEMRSFDAPMDVLAFVDSLKAAGDVVRAKGWVTGIDGQRHQIHVVGRRAAMTPVPDRISDAPTAPDHVVVIRRR